MNNHDRETVAITVRGRVQGVGFRMFVAMTADRLNVSGWARNLPDGSVQLQATAARPALSELITAVRVGPRGSRVEHVETEILKAPVKITGGFRILQ